MNRIVRIVVVILAVLAFAASAFAQARPTPNTQQAPATPPGSNPPATPTTDFTVTSMVPGSVVSAANDYPKLVKLSGGALDKIDVAKLKLSDGTTDLTIALADQPTAKVASLTVTIPATSKGEFVLSVDGTETKLKLVVKDAAQVAAEKAEAERKQTIANAKAGAAAAFEVKALRASVILLQGHVQRLNNAVGTSNGQDGKIADLEKTVADLREQVTTLKTTVNENVKVFNENTAPRLENLERGNTRNAEAISAIGAVVVQAKPKKGSLEALRAELVAKGYLVEVAAKQ